MVTIGHEHPRQTTQIDGSVSARVTPAVSQNIRLRSFGRIRADAGR